jgi:predicted alpha/beta-fold hydrolase
LKIKIQFIPGSCSTGTSKPFSRQFSETQAGLMFDRERISTEDGDFLDLDWLRIGSDHLVIISHGLEGNSRRPYMKGMAKVFFENGL